jgi:hypothetical protein
VIGNSAAASHLAELDARFEGHLGAVHLRAAQLREQTAGDAEALRERCVPPPALLVRDEDVALGSDA